MMFMAFTAKKLFKNVTEWMECGNRESKAYKETIAILERMVDSQIKHGESLRESVDYMRDQIQRWS